MNIACMGKRRSKTKGKMSLTYPCSGKEQLFLTYSRTTSGLVLNYKPWPVLSSLVKLCIFEVCTSMATINPAFYGSHQTWDEGVEVIFLHVPGFTQSWQRESQVSLGSRKSCCIHSWETGREAHKKTLVSSNLCLVLEHLFIQMPVFQVLRWGTWTA